MTGEEPQEFQVDEESQTATFDRLISPLSRESFLSGFWGQSFLHLAGPKGRFRSLLTWEDLNSILELHHLEPPRLILVRDAKPIDPNLFMGGNQNRSRLNAAGLINCLAEGATLILDYVDELAPAVGRLAEAVQEVLRSQTNVNLYAGWRNQSGFDLHWDSQDTIILQVSGRKHWKVYRPTRLHPLMKKKDVASIPKPTGDPIWEGILEDGDMIYLPRGWWHVAAPLDEPTLHLTVTIIPADGIDLLRWLIDQLTRHAEIRMNLPHLANDADQKQYVGKLRELLMESCPDDVLERFMVEWEAKIPLRPRIRLPFGPVESRAPITMETNVRLAGSRRVVFLSAPANGTVSFVTGGIRGECSTELIPALKELSGTASSSVRELCGQLPDQNATGKLIILLTALAMRGVLQIEHREKDNDAVRVCD